MSPLRARVEKGRLVLDEPTTLPEGTVVDLVAADEDDDLTDDERQALHEALTRPGTRLKPDNSDLHRQFSTSCVSVGEPGVRTTSESDVDSRNRQLWRSNRLAAPDLFLDELAASSAAHASRSPVLLPCSPVPRTRRLLLAVSRYHVYYVPQVAHVTVLAVWHARRGVGPPLRIR
jgi:hypothetical protein